MGRVRLSELTLEVRDEGSGPPAVLLHGFPTTHRLWDGVVPVLPVSDTVKRVRDGQVLETLARDGLVVAQTPQAFLAPALRAAVDGEGTDCAALVEARGGRLKAVEGDPRLLKVTSAADLELVASWL